MCLMSECHVHFINVYFSIRHKEGPKMIQGVPKESNNKNVDFLAVFDLLMTLTRDCRPAPRGGGVPPCFGGRTISFLVKFESSVLC